MRGLWARHGCLWMLLGASLLSPAHSATLDLGDLAPPRLSAPPAGAGAPGLGLGVTVPGLGASAAPGLPAPSPALDAAGQQAFREAAQLFLAQDFAPAEKISRALTLRLPEAPEGWYLLGMVLANLGQREEAVQALERAAQGYGRNAAPLLVKGDLLLSLGRVAAAGEAWRAAVERDPGNGAARQRLAAYLESQGDAAGALREYEAALAAQSPGGNAGTNSEAEAVPRLQAARLQLLRGDPAAAEALLEPLAARPDAPLLALDYLGRAKVGLDKLDEGAALFDRLIPLAEGPRPALARARIAVAAQDLPRAADVLAAARTRFPGDPAVLLEQGRIFGAQGDYAAALEALSLGLKRAPDDLGLLRAAALAASRLGEIPVALEHARRAAALPGALPEDRLQLAALEERSGALDAARGSYRALLALDPQNWLALNNLANLLLEADPDQALSLAERAVAARPDQPRLRDTLGLAQLRAGAPEAAARTFEALRAEAPKAALPVYRLGQLRLSQGETAAGRALLEEALRLEPDFPYAAEARRQLE